MNKSTLFLTVLMSMSSYLHAQDQPETTPTIVETPVAIEAPPSLTTTNKGQIQVTKDDKTISVSKAPNSPLINTITAVTKPSNTIQNVPKQDQRVDTSDITNNLSQADIDYIRAVNDSEERTYIESKVANNEVLTEKELKTLRKINPNY